jgi:hypothetical protein
MVGVLASVTMGVWAQSETVEFADGTTITLPGGWKIVEETDDYTDVESDRAETSVRFYFYTAESLADERVDSLEEFAEYDYNFYDVSEDQPFNARLLRDSTIADEPAVEYTFEATSDDGDKYDIILVYFLTEDGAGLSAEVQSYYIDTDPNMNAVYDLLDTLSGAQDRRGSNRGERGGDTQTISLLDGTTLDIPADWFSTEGNTSDEMLLASLTNDGIIEVRVEAGVGGFAEFDTPEKYLEYIMRNSYPRQYDRGEVVDSEIAGLDAAQYDFIIEERGEERQVRIIVAILPNTNAITFFITGTEDFDATLDTAQQIADTMVASDVTFCFVFAPNGVNLRDKASTSGGVVIKIDSDDENGEVLTADYGTEDGNGAVWFHVIEYDAFVRQDVVFFDNNSCGNLPLR